jgi:hypothetical protein
MIFMARRPAILMPPAGDDAAEGPGVGVGGIDVDRLGSYCWAKPMISSPVTDRYPYS